MSVLKIAAFSKLLYISSSDPPRALHMLNVTYTYPVCMYIYIRGLDFTWLKGSIAHSPFAVQFIITRVGINNNNNNNTNSLVYKKD